MKVGEVIGKNNCINDTFWTKEKKTGQESWQLEKSENIAEKIVPCKRLYDLSREKRTGKLEFGKVRKRCI